MKTDIQITFRKQKWNTSRMWRHGQELGRTRLEFTESINKTFR